MLMFRRYLSRFFYVLAGKKKQLLILLFFILLSSMLETFGIGLIGPFIALATDLDSIRETAWSNWLYTAFRFQSSLQFISIFGVSIVCILCVKSLLSFGIAKYIFDFGFGQQAELRARLMHAYMRAPYTFHLTHNTAQLVQNILKESEGFANRVTMPILFSTANSVVIASLLTLLFITDVGATLAILFALLLAAMFLYRFRHNLARWGREGHEADVEMIRAINHGLGGLKDVKVIGCEFHFEAQLVAQAEKFKRSIAASSAFSSLPRFILEPILIAFLVGFSIIYLVAGKSPQSLTSTLSVFGLAAFRLLPAASNLLQSTGYLKNSTYIVDEMYLTLKELEPHLTTPWQEHLSNKKYFSPLQLSSKQVEFERQVEIKDVTYYYPNSEHPALEKVSLEINKGQAIGLIGKSGSGKTTLVDVILGLLMPRNGDIQVDSNSIYKDMRSWQNLIAYIPQSIFLTDETIKRNIAFGVVDDQIDEQRLHQAMRAAQLIELIEQLPNGVETYVGERGVRLSGGQRQRVGIARALYHQREILVLDEATAALDTETESLVTDSIKSLTGTKTMIIIAHRLSTIEHCDRIYVLEKGRVKRSGSYQEVVVQVK
jgi:ABC-type multidrug transport system fused ATPase/permease subunit